MPSRATSSNSDEPYDPASDRDPEVTVLLASVQEFVPRYLELVEYADDDPGAESAFTELADYVSELAGALEANGAVLARCFAAVEQVAQISDDAEELIGWSFLDYLSLDSRRALLPWFGPRTLAILEAVEDPNSGSHEDGNLDTGLD